MRLLEFSAVFSPKRMTPSSLGEDAMLKIRRRPRESALLCGIVSSMYWPALKRTGRCGWNDSSQLVGVSFSVPGSRAGCRGAGQR